MTKRDLWVILFIVIVGVSIGCCVMTIGMDIPIGQ